MLNVLAHPQKYFFRVSRIIHELLSIMKLSVLKKITSSKASVTEKKPEPNNKKAVLILTKSSELLSLRETLKVLGLQIYLQKYLVVVQKNLRQDTRAVLTLSLLMHFIIQSF